jgi:hypothetical protein
MPTRTLLIPPRDLAQIAGECSGQRFDPPPVGGDGGAEEEEPEGAAAPAPCDELDDLADEVAQTTATATNSATPKAVSHIGVLGSSSVAAPSGGGLPPWRGASLMARLSSPVAKVLSRREVGGGC